MTAGVLNVDELFGRLAGAGRSRALSGPAVLITDGGNGQNRSALAAVRALAAGGYRPVVTISGPGPLSLAAASRHCAGVVTVPPVESGNYAAALYAELRRAGYLDVLPASDASLVALGRPGAELVDKARLASRAAAAGLPLPQQHVLPSWDALRQSAADLDYPVMLKPAVRTTSRQSPVRRVDTRDDLLRLTPGEGAVVVQAWVGGPMTAVCGLVREGRLVAVAHQRYVRTWPADAGVACALQTVNGDPAREECLTALLNGYDGVFQAQFLGPHLVDVNPRVYGSLPLALAAGLNLPARHCDLLLGKEVQFSRAAPGAWYRWVEGDVRHVQQAWRRGDMGLLDGLKSLRPHRRTAHSTESIGDPGPALARLKFAMTRGTDVRKCC